LLDEAIVTSQPMATTIQLARKLDRAYRGREAEEHLKDLQELRGFSTNNTERTIDLFAPHLRSSDGIKDGVFCRPMPLGLNVLEAKASTSSDLALQVTRWIDTKDGKASRMAQALDSQWSRLHELHNEYAPAGSTTSSPLQGEKLPSRCWSEGICVCSEEGKKLWTLRNALVAIIKAEFPRRHAERRQCLKESRVFCACRHIVTVATMITATWRTSGALSLSGYTSLIRRSLPGLSGSRR